MRFNLFPSAEDRKVIDCLAEALVQSGDLSVNEAADLEKALTRRPLLRHLVLSAVKTEAVNATGGAFAFDSDIAIDIDKLIELFVTLAPLIIEFLKAIGAI